MVISYRLFKSNNPRRLASSLAAFIKSAEYSASGCLPVDSLEIIRVKF